LLAAEGALYVDEVKAPCGIGDRTNVRDGGEHWPP